MATVTNTTEQRLFDVHSAVVYLRRLGADAVTVNFVRALINRGSVPHLRIGKKFYISRECLDQWIDRQQRRK